MPYDVDEPLKLLYDTYCSPTRVFSQGLASREQMKGKVPAHRQRTANMLQK